MKIKHNTTAFTSFRDDIALCAASAATLAALSNPHLLVAHFILAVLSMVWSTTRTKSSLLQSSYAAAAASSSSLSTATAAAAAAAWCDSHLSMFAKRFSYQKQEFNIQTSFFYRFQTPTAAASKKRVTHQNNYVRRWRKCTSLLLQLWHASNIHPLLQFQLEAHNKTKKFCVRSRSEKKNYNSSSSSSVSSGRQSFTIDGYLHQTRLKRWEKNWSFQKQKKKNTNKQIPYISARRRDE